MKLVMDNIGNNFTKRNFATIYITAILLLIPFLLIPYAGMGTRELVIAAGFFSMILLSFNYYLIFTIFTLSIFIQISLFNFQLAVLMTGPLLLSFLIYSKNYHISDLFDEPVTKPLLFYFVTVLPSLFVSVNPFLSLVKFYNFIAILIVMYSAAVLMSDPRKILRVIYFYLALVSIETIYVIMLAYSTGSRVFGMSGVFYVDFSGIGVVLAFIITLFSSGKRKMVFAMLTGLNLLGLLFTQTRNAWISTGFTLLFLFIYLYKKNNKTIIPRQKLVKFGLIISVAGLALFFAASNISSGVSERLEKTSEQTEISDNPVSILDNTLLTRGMIWHTAYNAFIENPVIGIGLYSFPFTSSKYYTIPREFYYLFVYNATPHIAYLAALTETGIIGFIGFIVFILSIIKVTFRTLSTVFGSDQTERTLLVSIPIVYAVFSMLMTDAWLFGQQGALLGLFLGLMLANKNYIQDKT